MPNAAYPLADYFVGSSPSGGGQGDVYQRAQRIEGDVWATTGTLANVTIRGRAQIQTHGALYSGQTAFNSGTGFWLEANNGVPRFSIGNSLGNNLTWDGSALSMTGALNASSGSIAGWTINANNLGGGDATLHSSGYLNLGLSNNIVRADATDATYRLWVGNAVGASAPFSVDKTGAMTSTAGSIAGWTINTTALQLGSAGTTRGVSSGSTAFFAGGSTPGTAPFHVSTAGAVAASNLTVTGGSVTADVITTGTLNFGSSGTVNTTGSVTGTFGGLNIANMTVTGTLTLGSGGKIIDADGSFWDQTGITLKSAGVFGDAIKWQVAGVDKGSMYASSSALTVSYASGGSAYLSLGATTAQLGGSGVVALEVTDTDVYVVADFLRINGSSTSYGIRWNNIANGGSASNWSSFTVANVIDKSAGYIKINIAGTNYRVPFFADA